MRLYKPFTLLVALAMLFATWVPAGAAPVASDGTTRQISRAGTTSFTAAPMASDVGVQNPEIAGTAGGGASGAQSKGPQGANTFVGANRSKSGNSQGNGHKSDGEGKPNPKLNTSFDGLYFRQQRLANGGNQFSVEPPDQGMCVGSGLVLETVNDVSRVYHKDGTPASLVEDLNTFYGYPPAIVRSPLSFGPFVTDPSCLFDQATQRFFNVVLTLDVDPNTGDFLGSNHLDIAVSQTADPTGGWNIYRLPVQDDGTQGTPDHGCTQNPFVNAPGPCLGDYPHIGADANGFYITTNEYEFFGNAFIGAQIYAFSKEQLAAGAATVNVTQINTAHSAPGGLPGFTVWAAQSPGNSGDQNGNQNSGATGDEDNGHHGTEYFLSSTAADEANCISGNETCVGPRTSDNILLWTLNGTRSLDSASPSLSLKNKAIKVNQYFVPAPSNQKAGDFPLGQCLNSDPCATFLLGAPDSFKPEVISHLDSNDTRMQQVSFANGQVWGALDTKVTVEGVDKAGIAYYIVNPRSAKLVRQGQFGLADNNLTYPAIGVTAEGRGVMAFTVVGDTHYPSAGYAGINADDGLGKVKIAAEGLGPDDGFTSYKAFVGNPPRTRWGDYGAAAVDGNTIWIASEYIGQTCTFAQYTAPPFGSCGGTRAALGNWYTRISSVTP